MIRSRQVQEIVRQKVDKGLNTYKNFFNLSENQSPSCLNVIFNNDGSFGKRLGSSTTNAIALESTGGYGMYDFGVLGAGGNDSAAKILLHFDGPASSSTIADSSPSNYAVTASGNVQIDTAQSKFGGAALYFSGDTGAFAQVADSTDWLLDAGNGSPFTIDGWFRWRGVSYQGLVSQYVDANNHWALYYNANVLTLYNYSSASITVGFTCPFTPTPDTWYHLMVARVDNSNASTGWRAFINGSSQPLTLAGGAWNGSFTNYNAPLSIGRFGGQYFYGWMDEFEITTGLARKTSDFAVPAEAYNSTLIQERRLLCSSGTGIYYSADVGKTWAIAQTSRTAALNYFGFVKDYIINTNDSYDPPHYWAGTAGQYFAKISTAAPAAKHALSHQGFAILLNESANKTAFYYVDQNSMFSSAWSSFKLPTDRNDELTAGFTIGRNLYVSSKYKIFRMDYIGGNPDWTYVEVRGWGFVPKTVQKISLAGMGEAVIGLDWTKKVRLFFGSDDEIISDHISEDNGVTPFYLDNINSLHLGKCWAVNDKKAQVYRLFLVYGESSQVSYSINFNYRSGAWYPETQRPYQSGILASDTADNLFMMGAGYNGKVVIMDSGNTEAGTAIDDSYTTPLFYQLSPARAHKAQQISLFFGTSSSGTIHLEDRADFSTVWTMAGTLTIASAVSSMQIRTTFDIPHTANVHQFKLASSSNAAEPWRCNLIDLSLSDLGIGRS